MASRSSLPTPQPRSRGNALRVGNAFVRRCYLILCPIARSGICFFKGAASNLARPGVTPQSWRHGAHHYHLGERRPIEIHTTLRQTNYRDSIEGDEESVKSIGVSDHGLSSW